MSPGSGLENKSSSIFDVPPLEQECDGPLDGFGCQPVMWLRVTGDYADCAFLHSNLGSGQGKSFRELVDLGRREHWIVDPQQLCSSDAEVSFLARLGSQCCGGGSRHVRGVRRSDGQKPESENIVRMCVA